MIIATIIPIQKGIPFDTLSYYSSVSLSRGAVVEVPFGKQKIKGLVLETTSLLEAKMNIKTASFSLKKIERIHGASQSTLVVVETLERLKRKIMAPLGSITSSILTDFFLELFQRAELSEHAELSTKHLSKKSLSVPPVVLGKKEERTDSYKRIIRSVFAEKKSVVFIAPTIKSLSFWYEVLQKGIEEHAVLFHSKQSKKKVKEQFSLLEKNDRPLLICSTPQYASAFIGATGVCIIEDESSSLYRTNDRFRIDTRVILETLFSIAGASVIYGDSLPRFETLVKTNLESLPRSYVPEKIIMTEITPYKSILPKEALDLILYCKKNKKKLFIYTHRKGIAPLSRCADCGTVVSCPHCTLPMVLRYKTEKGEKTRLFFCTHCGETLSSTHSCAYCQSWNIVPVSIGTDSIKEALLSEIDEKYIITVDDDITPDTATVDKLLSELEEKDWYVMVGTQKLLPFVKNIDYALIPFFERILSTPSPFIVEEALHLLFELNEQTKEHVVVCVQDPSFGLIDSVAKQKIQQIITEDLKHRKILGYPPFGILLKLSITLPSGQKDLITEKVEYFFKDFSISEPTIRKVSIGSMKVVCTWVIGVSESYIDDHAEETLIFLDKLKYPFIIDTSPQRI